MTNPILVATDIRLVRSRRLILDIPRFEVPEGQTVAIIGPNGAGKSSLLQSLALLTPASFSYYEFGGKAAKLPADNLALRRQMAMVFQAPLLLSASVLDNAASGLLLRGVPRTEAHRRAAASLERFGVGHLARRSARFLSGGEAQRVSLARALALSPRLLMLDEPFASLDVFTRGALLSELRPLLQAGHTTALLVTHDITEVAALADRVVVLEDGRIVQEGTPQDVFANPGSTMVKRMGQIASDTAEVLKPYVQEAVELGGEGVASTD